MTSKPLESVIETYLKNQIKAIGGLCYKFKSTVRGVPDQIVIYNGGTYLVEVKRPGEKPRKSQTNIHNKIKACGVNVHTVDTKETVDDFIRQTLKTRPVRETVQTGQKNLTVRSKQMFDTGSKHDK